jgi:phospholipid/cholesterol/gamma-HCH transport system substrate-binding protein
MYSGGKSRKADMEYKRNEIGAGIFLLVSFVILAFMIFAVSDIRSFFKKKKEINVLFRYSDGIEKNAQVRLSGIRVGTVADVRVAPEYGDKIELTLSVFSDTVIKEDTKAEIKTLGLVGGKYVELTGGSPHTRVLGPKDMLVGEESFKLEDLTKAGMEVVGKLTNIANNLDRILGDPALSKSIHASIQNIQEATGNMKDMTSNKEEVARLSKSFLSC